MIRKNTSIYANTVKEIVMSDVFMSVNGPVSRVNNKMTLLIDNFTAIKQKIKASASTHSAVFNSWMKRGGNTDLSWGQR